MKISAIRLSRHRLALEPRFHPTWSGRPRSHFDVDLVRVETDEGLAGIGSGDAMPGFAGHEHLFVGRDPLDLERHARVIDDLSLHYGRCWPLDVALWDLAGRIRGEPCWRLLGGGSGRVPVYASSGARRGADAVADVALRAADAGFAALKLRFWHEDWRDDLAAVEAARAAVGERLALMVDCNRAWRMPGDVGEPWTLDGALEVVRALEPLGLRWVEEPLHRGDWEGLSRLRDASAIPIAGGEMTREVHELHEMVRRPCLDVLQPDAVLVGGLTRLADVSRAARAAGIEFTPHTWGNGIGLAANAHLFAGAGGGPWLEFPLDPPEWTPERRDFPLAVPLEADSRGCLELGERPGLGVDLDEPRLERTRIA